MHWSRKTLDELENTYWDEIAPAIRRNGGDPHHRPTYQKLADLGYSGIAYALREHHDLTPKEFFTDVVDVEDPPSTASDGAGEHNWPTDHEETVELLDEYYNDRSKRTWPETTATTRKSRLKRYVRTYVNVNETGDLITPVRSEETRGDARKAALRVVDVFDEELSTDRSKFSYVSDVRDFYRWLDEYGHAAVDPLDRNIGKKYRWDRGEPDNPALDVAQVSRIADAASTTEERLLVVALCAWGLRPSEVAALRLPNINLDPADDDVPRLEFEERKNGPGRVMILYGEDVLQTRIDELAEDDEWTGWLFPSSQSASGHVISETISSRFKRLADDADLTVAGSTPTAKMGRRFWYSTYSDARDAVINDLEDVAEEQGAESPEVVYWNYLSDAQRRNLRREQMNDELMGAFN